MATQISIGHIKRDISDLINRVAYKGERIVITSRGHPKAVLINLEDYEKLQKSDVNQPSRAAWLENSRLLAERIRQRRLNQPVDIQVLLDENLADLEGRYGE